MEHDPSKMLDDCTAIQHAAILCNVRSEQHDRMMRCVQNCLSAMVN